MVGTAICPAVSQCHDIILLIIIHKGLGHINICQRLVFAGEFQTSTGKAMLGVKVVVQAVFCVIPFCKVPLLHWDGKFKIRSKSIRQRAVSGKNLLAGTALRVNLLCILACCQQFGIGIVCQHRICLGYKSGQLFIGLGSRQDS